MRLNSNRKSANKKSPGANKLIDKFYQTFEDELTPTLLKLFHEKERKGTFYKEKTLFYKVITALIPKLDKDTANKED